MLPRNRVVVTRERGAVEERRKEDLTHLEKWRRAYGEPYLSSRSVDGDHWKNTEWRCV